MGRALGQRALVTTLPARAAALAALGLALALSGITITAAAACRPIDDTRGFTGEGGCIKCSADKSTCEKCAERWVLTVEGWCAKCNATTVGWQETCVSCRADDPTVCLKCEDYCSTGGCDGYFVTAEGGCSRCPVNAAACDDLTAEIRKCRKTFGRVGGECRPCRDPNCDNCEGDMYRCGKCTVPLGLELEGYYIDPVTGICQLCDKGCRTCTGPGMCMECTVTALDPIKQACPPCATLNCSKCSQAVDKCQECSAGFRLDESTGNCVPCSVANCSRCPAEGTCEQCKGGYGQSQNDGTARFLACHKCQDPNCLGCKDDPTVCTACVDDMSLDPGTGMCGPCQVGPAQPPYCTHEDRTRCMQRLCAPGFYCHNATGQCTSCPFQGCLRCDDDASECDECLPGFWDASKPIRIQQYRASSDWDKVENLPVDCQPCTNAHCLVCEISYGAACEMCSDGYFLDRDTKLCRACTEPEGALYETCIPAPAPTPTTAWWERPALRL